MTANAAPCPLIIVGAGGHGAVVSDCVDPGQFTVIGYVDDHRPPGWAVAKGETVVGTIDDLPLFARSFAGLAVVIAVGDNARRHSMAERIERIAPDLRWPAILHPSAIVSASCLIGPGCLIAAGAIVNCRTRLGRHVLINTASVIEHDNVFAPFSSTGPGVVTGGNVEIGQFSHLGIGATVRHGIRIGANCVVGGQAYVDRSIEDKCVSFGVPARTRQHREHGMAYL